MSFRNAQNASPCDNSKRTWVKNGFVFFSWRMVYWWIHDPVKNRIRLWFCSHQFWPAVVHRPIASSQFCHFRPLSFFCRQNMHREWLVWCCTAVVRLRSIFHSSVDLRGCVKCHRLHSNADHRNRSMVKPMIFSGVLFRFTGRLWRSKQCFMIWPVPLSCWFSSGTKCFHSYTTVDLVRTRDVRWARSFWKIRPPL